MPWGKERPLLAEVQADGTVVDQNPNQQLQQKIPADAQKKPGLQMGGPRVGKKSESVVPPRREGNSKQMGGTDIQGGIWKKADTWKNDQLNSEE